MTRLARIEETSTTETKTTKKLETDFDRTLSNESGRLTLRRLGISECNQYSKCGIPANNTEREL